MNQNLNQLHKEYCSRTGEKIPFKDFLEMQVRNGMIPPVKKEAIGDKYLHLEGTKKVNSIRIFGLKPFQIGLIVVGTIGITILAKIAYKKHTR